MCWLVLACHFSNTRARRHGIPWRPGLGVAFPRLRCDHGMVGMVVFVAPRIRLPGRARGRGVSERMPGTIACLDSSSLRFIYDSLLRKLRTSSSKTEGTSTCPPAHAVRGQRPRTKDDDSPSMACRRNGELLRRGSGMAAQAPWRERRRWSIYGVHGQLRILTTHRASLGFSPPSRCYPEGCSDRGNRGSRGQR